MELQPAADVLQDFLAECELKLVHFAPQNISNMLWACATLGISPGTLPWQTHSIPASVGQMAAILFCHASGHDDSL